MYCIYLNIWYIVIVIIFDKGVKKMINHDVLWETMKARNITKYRLIHYHGFSHVFFSRLKKGLPSSTYNLDRLCSVLNCRIQDVVTIIPNKEIVIKKKKRPLRKKDLINRP